jgi:hypothetical protein
MRLWLLVVILFASFGPPHIATATQPQSLWQNQQSEQTTTFTELELVGYMLGSVSKIVTRQTMAVALTPGDLVVLDLQKPEQPRIVSRLSLSTVYEGASFFMADLALVGNYVFVSCSYCGDTGLIVVNVSTPTAPIVVGRLKTPGYVNVIKAYGDLLYIALGGDQLGIVDIRIPSVPKLLGSQRLTGQFAYVRTIEILEKANTRYALVVAQNGKLSIFDVTTAAAPKAVTVYAPDQACMTDAALIQHGDQFHLYVLDCNVGLRVLDVTFPAQPREEQLYRFGAGLEPYSITAANDLLFVITDVKVTATWDATLHVLATAGGARLTEVSTLANFPYTSDLADFDQMLVVADVDGIRLLDITKPSAVREVGRQVRVNAYSDLASDGRYLYLVDPTGFKVLDTINPSLPAYVAEIATPHALNVEVDAGFALVTDLHAGLWLFDIGHPTQPTVVSHNTIPVSSTTDIVISGTLGTPATAFIGGTTCSGFELTPCQPSLISVDFADLQQPVSSIILADGRGVADMVQTGDFLYVTIGSPALLSQSELLVFDIANPQLPIEVEQVPLHSTASSMAVVDQALYIALTDSLRTYDITNPVAPRLQHTLPLPHSFSSMSADKGFLYGKDSATLTLIALDDPFQPVLIERKALPSNGGSGIVAANDLLASEGFIYVLHNGLTIWRQQADLLGRVLDVWGEPQAGVMINGFPETVAAANGAIPFTFSGLTGAYGLLDNMTGAYTIQPTMTGYRSWPPTRCGVSHDTQEPQDFYLLAQPVSTTVAADTAATLAYRDSRDLATSVTIPTGAVDQTSVVQLTPLMAFAQGDVTFTGNAFALQLTEVATALEKPAFRQPVTFTIHYSDRGANALLDESSYQLMMAVNDRWQPLPDEGQAGQVERSSAENALTVTLRATGQYALFGTGHSAYLPLVAQ